MEQKVIDLKNRLEKNYKEQDKNQIYTFAASLITANPESLDVLESHGVELKKPSQTIVLAIEPQELERELKLAEEMGFIAAYQQNPRHLTQPIEMVIKRMAKADAVGVTYKNEKGTYASFIFSQRAFDYIMSKTEGVEKEIPSNTPIETDNNMDEDLSEVKENAMRLLEAFAMIDEKDKVFARLDEIGDKGLSQKEMLMEAFKIFGGDEKVLATTIDEVLMASNEEKRGRAA